MAKKFDPKFTPVDLETKGRESLSEGKCELKRVSYNIVGDVQSLVLQFQPDRWTYSIMVDITEDAPVFTPETPWEEILKTPITTKFMWLGKNYKASIRLDRDGTAIVEVREPLTAKTFKKNPFASFRVALEEALTDKPEAPGAVYGVSVASFSFEDGGVGVECDVFGSAEEAADWFERNWNEKAAKYGTGADRDNTLKATAKKKFFNSLKKGKADAESPDDWWGPWFRWTAVRKSV